MNRNKPAVILTTFHEVKYLIEWDGVYNGEVASFLLDELKLYFPVKRNIYLHKIYHFILYILKKSSEVIKCICGCFGFHTPCPD